MKLVSGIVDSGFFAQSALSAEVTTKDSLGRNISETYLTGVDLTPYQTTAGMTAYQPVGDYYSASNPSGFLTAETDWTDTITAASAYAYEQATAAIPAPQDLSYISGQVDSKLPTSAFSAVSGSFLTAHQSLPDSANWNSTYNTVSTNSGSWSGRPQVPVSGINIDIYESDGKVVFSGMTGGGSTYTGDVQGALDEVYSKSADWNSAAGMNELPVSAGQGMDIQNVDGNIVFSCTGGSVPEGVLVGSGLEYNAVNEISGYSGSAIAQYGAEKQWFTHDDTLCHVSNSAQYALGVNMSAISADLARMMGVDETVLWSGELSVGQTAALTEDYSAFRKLEFKYRTWSVVQNGQMKYEQFGSDYGNWQTLAGWQANNLKAVFIGAYSATDSNHIKLTSASYNNITATNAWVNASDNYRLFEIRGIGRKS